jgi:hypothetical protein
VLQELIGHALTAESQRLSTIVRTHLQPMDIAAFQRLLDDTPGLYALVRRPVGGIRPLLYLSNISVR